ncbi:hypothetical protein HID58_048940 [Brassica napus]|uniref:Secreted protein n=1 Tax=Brassica napus TaxID=3708 RepID=A0ABQ8B3K3_BRANA|nr:hypothetical protein HID58_048940 [Brassica napus]
MRARAGAGGPLFPCSFFFFCCSSSLRLPCQDARGSAVGLRPGLKPCARPSDPASSQLLVVSRRGTEAGCAGMVFSTTEVSLLVLSGVGVAQSYCSLVRLMVAGCRLWLPVVSLFGRFTSDSIFTASDLAFLALFLSLSGHQMARLCSGVIHASVLRLARLEVAVLLARLIAGIVGGRGECLLDLRCGSKRCVALHTNRLWWQLQGPCYSGNVKGNPDIRGNEENLTFPRTNVDG